MKGLDEKDIALLRALQKNARASLVSLARDADLSRSAAHDRIAKLEERGVIKAYTIRIDRAAVPQARAFLSVSFVAASAQSRLAEEIHAMPGVEGAYCLSGDIDMLVYCECDTAEEISVLRERLAALDGVTEISTRMVLNSSVS